MKTILAHTPPKRDSNLPPHLLKEHLQSVSEYCALYAGETLPQDSTFIESARLAGWLHDLGKYGDLFQRRLQGKEKHIDHWSAGAYFSIKDHNAIYSSLAIQGHHIGLQKADCNSIRESIDINRIIEKHPLQLKMSEKNLNILKERFINDIVGELPQKVVSSSIPPIDSIPYELDLRILYSCLVDADFLDTEAHFNRNAEGKQFRQNGPSLDAPKAFDALLNYIEGVRARAESSSEIQQIRDDLWYECLRAAESPAGTWTLSAPTGSGKTLSMLAFALRHAVRNNLRRIIVVIPFLTIIEQTAAIYRKVFGADYPEEFVLEDHSLAGTGEETKFRGDGQNHYSCLLAENWDAPIVITTHVQLLESLFSNRPFACRKLHNLARSVILFDEVQTLPLDIVLPTLSALSHLSNRFGSSIVFATATQPAFDHLNPHVKEYGKDTEWQPKEIVSSNLNLFSRSKRTAVRWPDLDKPAPFSRIAEDLLTRDQVLCIVNVKRHAWELIGMMNRDDDGSLFHLSTCMCPAHRTHTLELIRQRLEEKKPCRLISTQCVEAGVDIDFLVVYRALGPLEAIAQAAGRCNRNGLWKSGGVVVFLLENDGKIQYPPGGYEQAASVTRMLLKEKGEAGMDIDDPHLFEEYYRTLYDLRKPESMNKSLKDAIMTGDFPEIAKQYRVIKQNAINVLAPYGGCIDLFRSLRAEAEENGLSASWIRRSRPLTVNLYKTNSSDKNPYLIPISYHGHDNTDWYYYSEESHYDNRLGLIPEQPDLLLI